MLALLPLLSPKPEVRSIAKMLHIHSGRKAFIFFFLLFFVQHEIQLKNIERQRLKETRNKMAKANTQHGKKRIIQ